MRRKAKDTLTALEMNHGEVDEFDMTTGKTEDRTPLLRPCYPDMYCRPGWFRPPLKMGPAEPAPYTRQLDGHPLP